MERPYLSGCIITERKRAEKELLNALEKEKELVRLKSGFGSMVSHEFRTPLAVIVSCAEILRDYQAELRPEKKRRHLDTICEADGSRGIALARKHLPDLILCDVMMPELGGHGVLHALREDKATRAIPFLFLSAKGDATDVRAGMNLGADDYLTKPVTKRDLLAAIAVRLKQRQLRDDPVAGRASGFQPDFSSAAPLEALGLTPREAEVLLWVAQGKTSAVAGTLLGISNATVKRHLLHTFVKLGVETRIAATLRALEVLSSSTTGK